MADQPNQSNSGNDFPDASENSSFGIEKNIVNPATDIKQPKDEGANKNKQECYNHPNINVQVTQPEDSQLRNDTLRTNKFSRISVVVNIFLATLTLIAIGFSWWAAHIANDTFKHIIAEDSARDERDKNLDKQHKNESDFAYTRDTTSMGISNRSLDAQKQSIHETQKQFTFLNRPFVQIENIVITNFQPNQVLKFEFNLENLGNYPLKIVDLKYNSAWRMVIPTIDEMLTSTIPYPKTAGKYITRQNPITIAAYRPSLSKKTFDDSKAEKISLFLGGKAKYLNLLTGKPLYYDFLIRIWMTEPVTVEYIVNNNRD